MTIRPTRLREKSPLISPATLERSSLSRSVPQAPPSRPPRDGPSPAPQGKSYPPVFREGDTVKLELNKDTQQVRMWVNDNAAFTVDGVDRQSKFFVNMEGAKSAVELVRVA